MNANKTLHVRRCHLCGKVSESCDDIIKCTSCHKSLLPFYYFDKKAVAELSDNQTRPDSRDRDTGYGPIRGLTAYW